MEGPCEDDRDLIWRREENQMSASQVSDRMATDSSDLDHRCDVLRSLQTPGAPLVLPNAWDVGIGAGRGRGRLPRRRDDQRRRRGRARLRGPRACARRRDARGGGTDQPRRRRPRDGRRRGGLRHGAGGARRRPEGHRRRRVQPRGHRPHLRLVARSGVARGVATRGARRGVGAGLPARDQRPDRRVPVRADSPGPTLPRPSSCPTGSGGRTPTSMPVSIACSRSRSGRSTPFGRSSRTRRGRSTSSRPPAPPPSVSSPSSASHA